jgi:hypothetical protein
MRAHNHAAEVTVFVGLLLALLLLVHACAGVAPEPIIEPPIVTTASCQSGCQNLASPAVGCLTDAAACISMCNDSVTRNLESWTFGMAGPTCWANATSRATAIACPGWSDAGCP